MRQHNNFRLIFKEREMWVNAMAQLTGDDSSDGHIISFPITIHYISVENRVEVSVETHYRGDSVFRYLIRRDIDTGEYERQVITSSRAVEVCERKNYLDTTFYGTRHIYRPVIKEGFIDSIKRHFDKEKTYWTIDDFGEKLTAMTLHRRSLDVLNRVDVELPLTKAIQKAQIIPSVSSVAKMCRDYV